MLLFTQEYLKSGSGQIYEGASISKDDFVNIYIKNGYFNLLSKEPEKLWKKLSGIGILKQTNQYLAKIDVTMLISAAEIDPKTYREDFTPALRAFYRLAPVESEPAKYRINPSAAEMEIRHADSHVSEEAAQ